MKPANLAQAMVGMALATVGDGSILKASKSKSEFRLADYDTDFLRRWHCFKAGSHCGNVGENRKDKFIDGERYAQKKKKKLGIRYVFKKRK